MTNQLSHFAIHADDLDRARKFYGAVFDWKFQGFGGGPITDFCQIKDAAGNPARAARRHAIAQVQFRTAASSRLRVFDRRR